MKTGCFTQGGHFQFGIGAPYQNYANGLSIVCYSDQRTQSSHSFHPQLLLLWDFQCIQVWSPHLVYYIQISLCGR
jgi:hypothetical protein